MSLVTSDSAYIVTYHHVHAKFHEIRHPGDIVLTRISDNRMLCFFTRDNVLICANGQDGPMVEVSLNHRDNERVVDIAPRCVMRVGDSYIFELFMLMSSNTLHKIEVTHPCGHDSVKVDIRPIATNCVAVHCHGHVAKIIDTTGNLMVYRNKELIPTGLTIPGLQLAYVSMWCDHDNLVAWDGRRVFVQYYSIPTRSEVTHTMTLGCVAYAQVLGQIIAIHTTYGAVIVGRVEDISDCRTYTGYKSVCPMRSESTSFWWLCCKHDGGLDVVGYDMNRDQPYIHSHLMHNDIGNVVLTCVDPITAIRATRTKRAAAQH